MQSSCCPIAKQMAGEQIRRAVLSKNPRPPHAPLRLSKNQVRRLQHAGVLPPPRDRAVESEARRTEQYYRMLKGTLNVDAGESEVRHRLNCQMMRGYDFHPDGGHIDADVHEHIADLKTLAAVKEEPFFVRNQSGTDASALLSVAEKIVRG